MDDVSHGRAESSHDLGKLALRSFRTGEKQVIAIAGRFDGSTMKTVEHELESEAGAAQIIVLDLRRLEFIDSSGLRVVVITGARPTANDTPG
jgi:anti-anti-sigma factor